MTVLKVKIERAGYPDREGVIEGISFAVKEGELVGLIGPNGAGKSTTIKSILGLLKDVDGEIEFGEETGKSGTTGAYAYIPEHPILYDDLTLWEHLELAASGMGMEEAVFHARAVELLERFKLSGVRDHLPESFSKGMQQKIMLILGFLNRPDVYIVDEPFIGLDPRAIKDFLDMLDEERKRGAGVLMSTHVLDTAERICDTFLLLSEGRQVAYGNLEEIRRQCGLPDATLFECFHSMI